jgi:hypothetical protein
MKPALLLALLLPTLPLSAAPLSLADHAIIMSITDSLGVPRSVADRLQIEESGDPGTGAWGDSEKIGPVGADGSRSRGLYGISMRWQGYLVELYYPHEAHYFDWRNPIDSAVVGLGYLSALHHRFGNWFDALCYYNIGRIVNVPSSTREYARRIVDARAP